VTYPNPDPAQYPSGATTTAPRPPTPPDRRGQAYVGGLIAGMGIAIALAVVMHVIQQQTPSGFGIGRSVLLVLLLGLMIGLGLGTGMAAAVPDRPGDSAPPHHATPTDQPPVPSA
jgi:predicted lipid-binding transport protein (Tim44 family)